MGSVFSNGDPLKIHRLFYVCFLEILKRKMDTYGSFSISQYFKTKRQLKKYIDFTPFEYW